MRVIARAYSHIVAYLNDNENLEGIWLIFDLAGTLTSLVRRKDGIMKVIDIMGDKTGEVKILMRQL